MVATYFDDVAKVIQLTEVLPGEAPWLWLVRGGSETNALKLSSQLLLHLWMRCD